MSFRRWIPSPIVSLALLATWLLLARNPDVADVVIGTILALALPLAVSNLGFESLRLHNPRVAARYVLLVVGDVLRSNVEVAWGVVRWRRRRAASCFVVIPLELRDPVGLAVLAMVTTIVPGTVWSELASDRSALLLHVWDAPDPDSFASHFKARYEQPLREIFE